ncbi:MAG: hypothetical protein A2Y40_03365 [Candidatus Margulisbacteria bacterium GWF2_35_9]|nr:MAG: hypothetical protein A2Y40_03365 [Candidatus Margulisbacteria bacterium GWF2_35_9]
MKDKIIELLAEVTEDATIPEWANENTSINNDIVLDSLQLITFILTVEDEFAIEIVYEEFDFKNLNSIAAFCSFIKELGAKTEPTSLS